MKNILQRFAIALSILIAACLWLQPARVTSSSMVENSEGLPSLRDAKTMYNQSCAKCHDRDGQAKSVRGKLTHARDLTDAQWQQKVSDERIFNVISNGKGKMPAFGKKFSEAEINELVNYVRSLKK